MILRPSLPVEIRTGAEIVAMRPHHSQVLDIGGGDLRQYAVALARVVAVKGGPRICRQLPKSGRIEQLRQEAGWKQRQQDSRQDFAACCFRHNRGRLVSAPHFRAARYARTFRMSGSVYLMSWALCGASGSITSTDLTASREKDDAAVRIVERHYKLVDESQRPGDCRARRRCNPHCDRLGRGRGQKAIVSGTGVYLLPISFKSPKGE